MRGTTYAEEMRIKFPGRPYASRPAWELRNMITALKMFRWNNTPEEEQRLQEAEAEIKARRGGR